MRNGCPFCDYEGPSEVLRDELGAFVIEPLRQITPGHVLVIPHEHVADFSGHVDIAGRTMKAAARWVRDFWPDDDVNLISSKGAAATQTVKHLHIHIVPRRAGDGLQLPWANPNEERDDEPYRDDPIVRELRGYGAEADAKEREDALRAKDTEKNRELNRGIPVWIGQDGGGPYQCPVCGSVGTGFGMADHIAERHSRFGPKPEDLPVLKARPL